jgi:3-hydroxyisobutyrate dehydrogenase-like beta-hydroxyacid dehydrogenase
MQLVRNFEPRQEMARRMDENRLALAGGVAMLAAMKIAFIGLGRMGAGMARNVLRAGHSVAIYNRSREKAEALGTDGARVASSPADATKDADAVMTMVADDQALEQIVFGNDGIASAMKAGCVHISHSTISTALARRLTAEHAHRKQGYLSAPVFGRPEAAESKNLLVVAAGPGELVERCRPLFDAIGRQTFVIGAEPWQANVAKVCGNFMVASAIEALGEAFATLRKAGVAPEIFLEIMHSLFGSQVITGYARIIAQEKFEPAGFALKLGLKDVRLVLAASEECASPMPLASLVHDHLLAALAQGQGEMDWSSMAQVIARNAGLKSNS